MQESEGMSGAPGSQAANLTHFISRLVFPAALFDAQQRLVYVNPALAALLDYEPEGLQRLAPADWILPQDRPRFERLFSAAAMAEGAAESVELKLIAKNGQFRYTQWTLETVVSVDGRPLFLAQVADKTTEKRCQRALYEAERAYEELFNTTNEGIAVLDPQSFVIRNVNSRMARLFGYEAIAMEGMGVHTLKYLEPTSEDLDLREACVEALSGAGKQLEIRCRRKEGAPFWAEVVFRHAMVTGRSSLIAVFRDIEARKRSENTLRNSEERYRSLFNTLNDAILLLRNNQIVDCNPKALEIFIAKRDELINHPLSEFQSASEDGAPSASLWEARLTGAIQGDPQFFECRMLGADGRLFEAEVSLSAFMHSNAPAQLVVLRDISARKRVEMALRESEEKLEYTNQMMRQVLDTIPVRVFWKDCASKYLGCNRVFAEDSGLATPEEILGKSDYDLEWGAKEAQQYQQDDQEVIASGQSKLNYEEPQSNEAGEVRWLRTSKIPLRDRENQIIGILGTYEDITESRAIEEERMRLSAAIEQAAEDIVLTDREGRIIYVNPAFEHITGYSREEALGKTPALLKSGRHDNAFYAHLWETITQGRVWKGRIINRAKDGHLFHEDATISPIRGKEGQIFGYVALKRDVTEEVHLENQLRQAQKMEAVGQLAGGVAHDFNNLLQAIQGYTDITLYSLDQSDPNYENLREVLRAADRAGALVRQLLTFSRREALQPICLDINAVIGDLLKLLRRVLGEHIELRLHTSSSIPSIYADPGQIEQVLMNLCVNARDAMPEGGAITIETGSIAFDADYCEANPWARPGNYVTLSVSDSGMGIPPELHERIFEPFFTTKEVGEGTGLGLATVYAIVRRHEGMIHLYSEIDEGSCFRIYFPVVPAAQKEASGQDEAENQGPGGTETLLFAEDDPMVRKLALTFLKQAGYTVLIAEDGEEAIARFEAHKDAIDGVLLDVIMPKRNGRAVYEYIRAQRPQLPVLFSSGYSANMLESTHLPKEQAQLISKPYRRKDLLLAIRQLFDACKG